MSKKSSEGSKGHSDILTGRISKKILIPTGISALFLIAAITCYVIDIKTIPLVSSIVALIPLLISIAQIRSVIDDDRKIMNDLSFVAEKQEEVINCFSHKIREPLNNLVLLSGMIKETSLTGKQLELIETLAASTDTMVEVVNDLTMETAGNLTFENRNDIRYKLGASIQDTIDLFKLNAKHDECLIIYDDKGEGEIELTGDPIIIKQILIDLLSTAVSSSDGKIAIKIMAREAGERDGNLLIEFTLMTNHPVEFIGEGKQAFTLAARLIQSAGGNWQESSTSDNSFFVFTLLSRRADIIKKKDTSTSLIKGLINAKGQKEVKDLSILLVEDNPINQRITQLMLQPLVRKIEIARNGKEALEMFGSTRFDLILMDVQMPVMNGLVAAEKIRGLESSTHMHTPMIAITANAMLGDKEQCLAVGMDDYISKPIDPDILIGKIKALI
jgi:CheY-like chemotaxis protein